MLRLRDLEKARQIPEEERKESMEAFQTIQRFEEEDQPLFKKGIKYDFYDADAPVSSDQSDGAIVKIMPIKHLKIPDYLKCPLSRRLMDWPVMIRSGRSYEKRHIEQYFRMKRAQADEDREAIPSDEEYDEGAYFTCPVTYERLDQPISWEDFEKDGK